MEKFENRSNLINEDEKINEESNTFENSDFKQYEYVHDFEWTEEMEREAKIILQENEECTKDTKMLEHLNFQSKNWEKFYKFNKTNFFKDRHYILRELAELKDDIREKIKLLDIGCGVGNTFYPLIEKKQNLIVNAFDFSRRAVSMAKTHPLYDEKRINLDALDLVDNDIPDNFKGANYAILMFVLSAIVPEKHEYVIRKIHDAMDIEGILYFRDYSLYDMAQMRFAKKKKNKLGENLYMRTDKTLAFYFNREEIENLFKKNGFEVVESKTIFRLIENRKDNLKMHRLWLQIKLKKI